MSPLPATVTSFVLSPSTPSATLYLGSSGQPTPMISQHLLSTSGYFVFAVAIVSVAGYFYHRRGINERTGDGWISLSGLLSSLRHRGSMTSSADTCNGWPVDLEAGREHVNMVYARFFHPTFWDLVDCHPATSSTPAIYVEREVIELPKSEPNPYGMNSFLDMDDDDDDDDDLKRKAMEQVAGQKVKRVPPYDDISTPTNCNFSSNIIGVTVHQGPFLSVPEDLEVVDSSQQTLGVLDTSCSVHGTFSATRPISCSRARRYGMADMAKIAKDLVATVLEEPSGCIKDFGVSPVSVPSRRGALSDISKFTKALTVTPYRSACEPKLKLIEEEPEAECQNAGETTTPVVCDIPSSTPRPVSPTPITHLVNTETKVGRKASPDRGMGAFDSLDSLDSLPDTLGDIDSPAVSQEIMDLMRKLLDELREPILHHSPLAFTNDSDSENDGGGASVPPLTPTRPLSITRRRSLESVSSVASTDSDASRQTMSSPITPPLTPPMSRPLPLTAPLVSAKASPGTTDWDSDEVQVVSLTSSPPSAPSRAYVRGHRYNRFPLYGPKLPLLTLPLL
ncbi:hypothetical protein BS17DRAFT_766507 [Gyrodon lividus]|nr:hypothetical protein BS17DRAFT_766507 [Gyrodon lividus]